MKTATEIANEMKNSQEWNLDLCAELCELAGMKSEWDASDGETFESVVFAAADALGVEII